MFNSLNSQVKKYGSHCVLTQLPNALFSHKVKYVMQPTCKYPDTKSEMLPPRKRKLWLKRVTAMYVLKVLSIIFMRK